MDMEYLLVGTIVVLLVAVLAWFFAKLKKAQDEIRALIASRFPEAEIRFRDPRALHIARESRGYSQSRGNGNLILTDRELFFAMPLPKTIYSIPLKSIGEVETPLRMGGKCITKPLLKVNFTTEGGEKDAVGWYVRNLDDWVREIRRRAG